MHTHLYIFTCTHTYAHAHIHTYIHAHIHTYIHAHIHTHPAAATPVRDCTEQQLPTTIWCFVPQWHSSLPGHQVAHVQCIRDSVQHSPLLFQASHSMLYAYSFHFVLIHSKVLVAYGSRLCGVAEGADIYQLRYKGITVCFNTLRFPMRSAGMRPKEGAHFYFYNPLSYSTIFIPYLASSHSQICTCG